MNLAVPKRRPFRWGNFFKINSIRRRLFIYFVSLVVISLTFVASVSYFIAAGALEKNITLSASEMVDQISLHFESYLQKYQQFSLSALGNQFVLDFLETPKNKPTSLIPYTERLHRFLFDPIITGNYEIEGIYLADFNGWVTGIGKKENQVVAFKDPELVSKITWLDKLPKDGSMLVSGVHPATFNQDSTVITLARRISAPGNPNKIIGVFWIDLNLWKIQTICEQVRLGKSGYITIIDATGKVIYHPKTDYLNEMFPFEFRNRVLATSAGHFLTEVEGDNSLVIFNTSPDTKWRLVAVVPFSEIAGAILRLKNITTLVIFLCVMVSILMAITFAATITKPIERLQRTMAEASKGNLDHLIPVESTDEVGKLTENFNQMLSKIQTLISDNYTSKIRQAEAEARQRYAELLALQAQINPHFLYNTLGTISSLAVLEGVESISQMAGALSDFFRYSIHTDEMIVTLQDELAQVERYFAIQKIRFGDRISLHVNVPEELFGHPIVKLTLQPLVENACIHGLELHGQGKIMIKIKIDQERLAILVSDTGAGIKETELKALQALLIHSESGDETGSHIGIGLRNVHSRLMLHYGNEYGLQIESKERAGTRIIVNIPFQGPQRN